MDFEIKDNSCLIVIDLQNDFCSNGSLEICKNEEIAPPVNFLINYFYDAKKIVLASKDWHPQNHISFRENQNIYKFSDLSVWPKHCVKNTYGSEFIAELETQKISEIFIKGFIPEMEQYSVLKSVNQNLASQTMLEYLKQKHIKTVYLCGIALEYCVISSALDFVKNHFECYLILNATVSASKQAFEEVLEICKINNIKIIEYPK